MANDSTSTAVSAQQPSSHNFPNKNTKEPAFQQAPISYLAFSSTQKWNALPFLGKNFLPFLIMNRQKISFVFAFSFFTGGEAKGLNIRDSRFTTTEKPGCSSSRACYFVGSQLGTITGGYHISEVKFQSLTSFRSQSYAKKVSLSQYLEKFIFSDLIRKWLMPFPMSTDKKIKFD